MAYDIKQPNLSGRDIPIQILNYDPPKYFAASEVGDHVEQLIITALVHCKSSLLKEEIV